MRIEKIGAKDEAKKKKSISRYSLYHKIRRIDHRSHIELVTAESLHFAEIQTFLFMQNLIIELKRPIYSV